MKSLFLYGDITSEKIENLMEEIVKCKNSIELYINSEGGDVAIALGFGIFLKTRKVKTIAIGECYSSAAIIFMGGSSREIYNSGELMFHRPHWEVEESDVENLRKNVKRLELFEKNYVYYLAETSGKDKRFWRSKLKKDWYLTPQEALREGLVSKIIQ